MRQIASKLTLLVGVLCLGAPAASWAAHLGPGLPGPGHPSATIETEDVRNTLHNLGDTISDGAGGNFNNPNIVSVEAAREVCVFCHTPHGANPDAPGAAPLWNRQVNISGAGYTMYNSPNFDSAPATAGNPGKPQGVSLACLSCHDGTFAVDALVNASGSGGFRGYAPSDAGLVGPEAGSALLTSDISSTMKAGTRLDNGPNYGVITGGARYSNGWTAATRSGSSSSAARRPT